MNNCSTCGHKLDSVEAGLKWHCSNCKKDVYANPVPATNILLFDDEGRILFGKRANEPYKGRLDAPSGFLDMNESFEQAIARELKEELGLEAGDYSTPILVCSNTNAYGDRQLIVVMFVAGTRHRDFPPNDESTDYIWLFPHEVTLELTLGQKNYYDSIQYAARYWQKVKDLAN